MIKLIACDMDGTLLDSQKRLPEGLIPALEKLRAQGVAFAVASGRQYAALRRDLEPLVPHIYFICENGALIMREDEQVFIDPVPAAELPAVIEAGRTLSRVYPVLCRPHCGYIERSAAPDFRAETLRYYPGQQVVPDLEALTGSRDVCKVAFYDEGDAQTHELPVLTRLLGDRLSVILSGEHWVDVMKPGVHKGAAMRGLQSLLGIRPEECMAFGDYLNDCELLEAVGESYAMENAHPTLKRMARHIAPSNDEDGVMRVLRERFAL